MSPAMERMMRAMNQDVPKSKRILELNATHPAVEKLKSLSGEDKECAMDMLYDSALIAEGSPVIDAARFTKNLMKLMLK
jgi:molecular chaperone HtpG